MMIPSEAHVHTCTRAHVHTQPDAGDDRPTIDQGMPRSMHAAGCGMRNAAPRAGGRLCAAALWVVFSRLLGAHGAQDRWTIGPGILNSSRARYLPKTGEISAISRGSHWNSVRPPRGHRTRCSFAVVSQTATDRVIAGLHCTSGPVPFCEI